MVRRGVGVNLHHKIPIVILNNATLWLGFIDLGKSVGLASCEVVNNGGEMLSSIPNVGAEGEVRPHS